DVPFLEEIAEARLREPAAAGVDRRVLLPPIDREPDPPPEGLERLLVLARDLETELDEVPARDDARRLLQARGGRGLEAEVGLVGRARVAADVEEVLDTALGREPVVVPAHGVED